MTRKIGVIGGGRFGQGLVKACASNDHRVIHISRKTLDETERVRLSSSIEDIAEASLIFVAVPSSHIESIVKSLSGILDGRHKIVHVSRGLVGDDMTPITKIFSERTASRRVGVLAGPLSAGALLERTPTGAVVGTHFTEVATAVREAIGSDVLRVYDTDDAEGVQIASALVGLLSVIVGFAFEIGVGPGALSVLAARGIAEASRIGERMGAKPITFFGLAGVGDLMAAIANDGRPETLVGRSIARGMNRSSVAESAGSFIEGLDLAHRVNAYVERLEIDAPITQTLVSVIDGSIDAQHAISELMKRQPGRE
ncbi:MAG: NAD(P)-binding domain-containing protein [Polyangiales bacterium]